MKSPAGAGAILVERVRPGGGPPELLRVPHRALTVVTGPPASGKTELAVSTLVGTSRRVLGLPGPDEPRVTGHCSVTGGLLPALEVRNFEELPPNLTAGQFLSLERIVSETLARSRAKSCPKCGNPILREPPPEPTEGVYAALGVPLALIGGKAKNPLDAAKSARVFGFRKILSSQLLFDAEELTGEEATAPLRNSFKEAWNEERAGLLAVEHTELTPSSFSGRNDLPLSAKLGSLSARLFSRRDDETSPSGARLIEPRSGVVILGDFDYCAHCGWMPGSEAGKERAALKLEELAALSGDLAQVEYLHRVSQLAAGCGLQSLSLDHPLRQLSTGELFRLRLLAIAAAEVIDVLVVADEPSRIFGEADLRFVLHQLKSLAESGNTVCVVENTGIFRAAADHIIDFGPFEPAPPVDTGVRTAKVAKLAVDTGTTTIEIAKDGITAITGRSGNGKSTSLRALVDAINRSKKPGRSKARGSSDAPAAAEYFSEAASYSPDLLGTSMLEAIAGGPQLAALFSTLPLARQRGLKADDFLWKKGKAPPARTHAVEIGGMPITALAARPISEILPLTKRSESLSAKLEALVSLGLGNHSLDTAPSALSFSEVQRLRLAHIVFSRKKNSRKTLIAIERPFSGLDAESSSAARSFLRSALTEGFSFVFSADDEQSASAADLICDCTAADTD